MELLWAKKIIKHNNRIIAVIVIKEELGEYNHKSVYIYIRGVYGLYFIDYILGRIL